MNFVPAPKRYLVKPLKEAEVTAGGILIPDNVKERPAEGTIVVAGPKLYVPGTTILHADSPRWANGDHILYGKYAGYEVKVDGEFYLILHEDEIFGKRTTQGLRPGQVVNSDTNARPLDGVVNV